MSHSNRNRPNNQIPVRSKVSEIGTIRKRSDRFNIHSIDFGPTTVFCCCCCWFMHRIRTPFATLRTSIPIKTVSGRFDTYCACVCPEGFRVRCVCPKISDICLRSRLIYLSGPLNPYDVPHAAKASRTVQRLCWACPIRFIETSPCSIYRVSRRLTTDQYINKFPFEFHVNRNHPGVL